MAGRTITDIDQHARPQLDRNRDGGELSLAYAATIAACRTEILKDLAGAESSTTAVSVALADDESILWAEAFGSIDQPDA